MSDAYFSSNKILEIIIEHNVDHLSIHLSHTHISKPGRILCETSSHLRSLTIHTIDDCRLGISDSELIPIILDMFGRKRKLDSLVLGFWGNYPETPSSATIRKLAECLVIRRVHSIQTAVWNLTIPLLFKTAYTTKDMF
ncbi:hypothetical protein PENTCL1PPCAC_19523 [Pristionchus entomophagus]|uniref:Uncharacterized protein n=1 Tax=Pristionchus entomophagus TaxID=358040 RepID=A0AAV5TS79_9BILA|nr:hypothetical protein PENTCL1PPCAC_19523 [Pristionchus entomophagus]